MGETSMMRQKRLAPGEYEGLPGSSHTAQEMFFDAISRQAPEVLRDLAGEPFAEYCALADTRPEPEVVCWEHSGKLSYYGKAEDKDRSPATLEPLRTALANWGTKWHLTDSWCYHEALITLQWWREMGTPNGEWLKQEPGLEVSLPAADFSFAHPGWVATLMTRSEYERWARVAFEAQLRAYLDKIAERHRYIGARKSPKKREPEHFDWLVFYQVLEMSITAIAHKVHKDAKTVEDAVKRTANLAQVALRKVSRGQPSRKTSI